MTISCGESSLELCRSLRLALTRAFAKEPTYTESKSSHHSLLAWSRHHLTNHFAKAPSKMHVWLADQLDAMQTERGKKVNLIGPRGGAKSTIGSLAFVLRAALEEMEPYIWIVSDTKNQAQAHLENIKTELLENLQIEESYPKSFGRGPRWRSGAIELLNGVVIEAYGTGQRIRGRRKRSYRPTLIVCDDLQNESHIASAYRRSVTDGWFHGTLLKAGTKKTNLINLATALHRDALAMQLDRTAGWQSRKFQAIINWPENQELWKAWESLYCDRDQEDATDQAKNFYERHRYEMLEGAELLWPEEEDLYTLMRMRVESGHTTFEREKQSSPVDPERCEWPETYFDESCWFDDWPDHLTLRTIAIDPSKGRDARQGDYSAIVLLGVDELGVIHIEADLARRPTSQMVADGVAHCKRFRPDAFGVEANQWQQLLAGEFAAEFQRNSMLGVSPSEITNHVNKIMRIRRLAPYLSQRRFRFKRGSPGTQLLVDQLKDFPIGSHDDGPDALEMALRLAEEIWRQQSLND